MKYRSYFITTCLFIVLLCLFFNVDGQNIDSLKQKLAQTPLMTLERGELLIELANIYKEKKPNLSLQYAEELVDLGKALNHDSFIFEGKMIVGVENIKKDDYYNALTNFQEAKEIAANYQDIAWKKKFIRASININGIYWYINDSRKAIEIAQKNIKIIKEVNDSFFLSDNYHSLGLLFETENQLDSSLHYLGLALEIYQKLGNQVKINNVLFNLSKLYIITNRIDEGKEILKNLFEQSQEIGDTVMLEMTIPYLAQIQLDEGLVNKALTTALYGEKLLYHNKYSSSQLLMLNEVLYKIYTKLNNPQKAIVCLQKIIDIKEARLIEEKKIKINELEVSFKIREKEKENTILLEKNKEAKARVVLLISIATILLSLIFIILFIYYRLKSSKNQLESLQLKASETNIKLNELINEKKHIINLIVHDVRTPLNIIQLNNKVIQHYLKTDHQAFQYIEEATGQIHEAILKIQETENKTLENSYFNFSVIDLRHTISITISDFKAYAKSKEITINFKMPNVSFIANADPFLIRHILSNLISNAIKFSDYRTTINIGITSKNQEIEIEIKDEGIGMDIELFDKIHNDMELEVVSTKDQNSWGKGLKLALMFVRKMGGDITMVSKDGKGSTFTIHIPKYLK